MEDHKDRIRNQFSKQARGFARDLGIRDREATDIVLQMTAVGKEDTVLDVACGPGILTCAFAQKAKQATGVDLVPAMLDRARELQKTENLANLKWEKGDATALPYDDNAFSVVTCRYSFHHMETPDEVLREMKRVCRPGGKVAVIDMVSSEDLGKAERFNHLEKLRDPSHVWALSLSDMKALFNDAGFDPPEVQFYNLRHDLESFMKRSFPSKENEGKVRRIIRGAVGKDHLGIKVSKEGGKIKFPYPVAVLVGVNA